MIPVSHARRLSFVAVLAILASPPANAARTPGTDTAQLTTPALDAPVPLLPGEAPPPESPPDAADGAVETRELGSVDADSGGMLEEAMGGFGIDMWAGTPRATILRLLPQLPARYHSPAMHDMARRLLLSTAIVPAPGPGDPEISIMGLRVERLEAMGLVGAVVDMVALAPDRGTDPYLLRAAIDSRLLLDDPGGACDVARTVRDSALGVYGEQVLVFCQTLSGELPAAALAASLLREGGQVDDPVFFDLTDALIGPGKAKIASLPAPTALHLAMARAAGAKLPSDVMETESPLMLRALADHPGLSRTARLDAAERAAQAGAISPRRLAERYAAVEFSAADLAKAVDRSKGDRTAVERALLYQASHAEAPVAEQAAAARRALRVAAEDNLYLLTARVNLPFLEIHPAPELVWFAADAARALYAMGQPARAAAWVELSRKYATKAAERQAADLLWPLARLSTGPAQWAEPDTAGHDRWLTALWERPHADVTGLAGLAYTLLEAAGDTVPEARWSALLDGVSRSESLAPDPAYLRAFQQAVAEQRPGETVLLALLLLGPSGPAYAGPDFLAEIIAGLGAVGLTEEGRRLAVEAALGGGL